MITNATLNSIELVSGSTPTGKITYAAPSALDVRCNLQALSQRAKTELQGVVKDSTAVARVNISDLPDLVPSRDAKLNITLDGFAAQDYLATAVTPWSHGSQSHYELLLRESR